MTVNTAFQFGFAQLNGANKPITDTKDFDLNSQADQSFAREVLQEGRGGGVNFGTRPVIDPKTSVLKNVDKVLYNGTERVGVGANALEIGGQSQHFGIVLKGLNIQSDMAGFLDSPVKALSQGYLSFGISHTTVNITLLNGGYQTTINSLLSGGWSTIPSTFVYGPYGSGLMGGIAYDKINK